jgi:hypothetical protein
MPDINFQCPSCSTSLNVSGEMANQLTECPACKTTIEVPIRTRGQTPPTSASFVAGASENESIFFQNGDILVTNARFVVGTKTFAMRGITSVEVVEGDEVVEKQPGNSLAQAVGGIGLIFSLFVGVLCCLLFDCSYWVLVGAGIVGILIFLAAALLSTKWKRAFKIVLKTAGGEVTAYQSFDRGHISEIIRALNNSIISQG